MFKVDWISQKGQVHTNSLHHFFSSILFPVLNYWDWSPLVAKLSWHRVSHYPLHFQYLHRYVVLSAVIQKSSQTSMCLYLHTQSNLILTCNEKVEKLTSCSAALLRSMITQYKYTACANKSFHLDLNKQKKKRSSLWKRTIVKDMYVLAGPYWICKLFFISLPSTSSCGCWNSFRNLKQLVFIKQMKFLR